jgi:hypothetical protein
MEANGFHFLKMNSQLIAFQVFQNEMFAQDRIVKIRSILAAFFGRGILNRDLKLNSKASLDFRKQRSARFIVRSYKLVLRGIGVSPTQGRNR